VSKFQNITCFHLSLTSFTPSTPYCCTTHICEPETSLEPNPPAKFSCMTSGGVPLAHTAPSTSLHVEGQKSSTMKHTWQPCAPGGINMELLRRKDQPILFFDEVLLYQVGT
jgi:hypothetical protein